MGAYNVAKGGVVALAETLAAELEGSGIGVSVLCPTFFQSSIAKSGRFADPLTRASAERLVERGKTAAFVARAAIRSVERAQLYVLPLADGRWPWRLKPFLTPTVAALIAHVGNRYRVVCSL